MVGGKFIDNGPLFARNGSNSSIPTLDHVQRTARGKQKQSVHIASACWRDTRACSPPPSPRFSLSSFSIMSRSVKEILKAVANEGYEPTLEEDALIAATLTSGEEKWRDRHGMLKAEGYELRPRLRPGWKPSWLESGADPFVCEDGELLPVGRCAITLTCPFDNR